MATIGEINVRVGVITRQMEKGLGQAQRKLDRFARIAGNIGNTLSQNITLPLVGLGAAAIKTAGDFERYEKGLESIMGSSEAAKKEIELLREAAKSPGLDLTQAIKGSVRLQSVKIEAELARKALANFGNAIALAGGTSADLDGVTLALTQIISKGKISAEEINQLAERVPQVRNAIQDAFGTGDSEQLQKLGISAEEFVTKVTEEMGKLPAAVGGISNSINNAGQAVTQFLTTLGNDINTTFNLTDKIDSFGQTLSGLADRFSNLDKGTKKTILTTAAFVAGVGPAVKIVSLLSNTVSSFIGIGRLMITNLKGMAAGLVNAAIKFKALDTVTKATTVGAIVTIIGGATIAFNEWSRSMSTAEKVAKTLNDVNLSAQQAIAGERVEIEKIRSVLDDETASRKDKIAAVEKLNAISPEYLGGLSIEKNSIQEINKAMDGYISRLEQRARLQAANEKLVEIEKELLQARNELTNSGNLEWYETATNLAIRFGTGVDGATVAALELAKNVESLTAQKQALLDFIVTAERANDIDTTNTNQPSKKSFQRNVNTGGTTNQQKANKQLEKDLTEEIRIREEFNRNISETIQARAEGINSDGITFEGFGAINTEMLSAFNEKLRESNELFAPVDEKALKMAETMRGLADSARTVGEAMYNASIQGASSFQELGKAALKAAADVVRAKIMEGISALVAKTIGTGPLGLLAAPAIAAAGGALFNSILKKINIPAFADGVTNFAGGIALVGERGPELVNLPRGSDVIPNEFTFGGNGNTTIQVVGRLIGSGDQLVGVIDETRLKRSRMGL